MSGRYRTRTAGKGEHALRLDARTLRQRGVLQEGVYARRLWSWTWSNGEDAGSIEVVADLTRPEDRHLELIFRANGEPRRQRIEVEALPMRFGGLRYYFRCPRSGRRCEVLASVNGYFASIRANRLAYASQSETDLDRMTRARDKLAARLWPKAGAGGPPRGDNRTRLFDRWAELDMAVEDGIDARLVGMAAKLGMLERRTRRRRAKTQ